MGAELGRNRKLSRALELLVTSSPAANRNRGAPVAPMAPIFPTSAIGSAGRKPREAFASEHGCNAKLVFLVGARRKSSAHGAIPAHERNRNMPSKKRSKLFVGHKVQRVLALRAASHWLLCLAIFGVSIFFAHLLAAPSSGLQEHLTQVWILVGPPLLFSFCLLPILVIDNLRLSNRFAGPMLRLQNDMRRLARGEKVPPVHFRDGDFFTEFAVEFNRLIEQTERGELPYGANRKSSEDRTPVAV